MTTRITIKNGIIVTIHKHIVSQEALACGGEGIRIDESSDAGIVITALQVVEPGFSGITVAMVVFTGII